ncbi:hypothetical protein TNCV_1880971 [Trichonephila clavipes]|nr:hypothetical protein TNCV_1880971 [Trichonephila clavipes]
MIKITASCDMWMKTKSVVSVAAIVGYNHFHTLRHRIKEALDVSLGYSSPCGFPIMPKLIWCRMVYPGSQSTCIHTPHVFDWR